MSSYDFDDTFDHAGLPSSPDPLDASSPGLGSPPNPLPTRHTSSSQNSKPSNGRRASAAIGGTPRRQKVQLEDLVLKTPPAGKSIRDQARCPSRSPSSTSISRDNMLSPWRIRVTVHAEREGSDGDEEQPQESSFDDMAFRRTTRATTTTVPLKGLGSSSPPMAGEQPERRRTRRSDLTPGRRKSTGPVTRASRRKTQGDLAEGLREGLSDYPRRGRGRPRKSAVPAQLGDDVYDAEVGTQDDSFDTAQGHQGPSLLDFASSLPHRVSQDRSLDRLPADPEPVSKHTRARLRKSGSLAANTTGRTLANEEEKSEESDDGLIVTTPRRRPRHSLLSLVSSPHKERFEFDSSPVGNDDDSPASRPVPSQRKRSKARRQAMSPLKIAVDRDAYLDEPSIDGGSRRVRRQRSPEQETAVLNDISLNRMAERSKSSSFNQTSSSQPSTDKGRTSDNLAQYPSSPPVRVAPLSPRPSDPLGLDSENDAAAGLQSSQYLPSPEPSPTKSTHLVAHPNVTQSPITVEEGHQQDESGQEEDGSEIDFSASVHDSMILDSEGFSMVSIESLTLSIPEIPEPSSEMNELGAMDNETPREESTEAESAEETKEGDDQSQAATPTQPLKISSSGLTTPECSSSKAPTPVATSEPQVDKSITAPPHSLITPDETPPPKEQAPYSPAGKGPSEVSRLQVLQPTVAQSPALAAMARTEQGDELSSLNSSPPARILGYAAQAHPLTHPLSRAGQQQTPSISYSSPKLPPPLPRDAACTRVKEPTPKHGFSNQIVTEAHTPGTEPTPKLTRVRRANLALQSAMLSPKDRDPVLGSPFRSPTAARRNSAPSSSPLATKANPTLENVGLFEGFSHSTQRELRAGLKYGEELARRGSEDLSALQITSAPLGENDVFRDEASRLSKRTAFEKKSEAYALAMPGEVKAAHRSLGRLQGHGVAIRSPLTAHLLQVDKDKDEDAMSWKADTPVKIIPADSHVPVEARKAGIHFHSTQLPGPAKAKAKSSMIDERELQWQREREQVSRQIDMANQSQVIVIGDSETDGDRSNTSDQQFPRTDEVEDESQGVESVEEDNVKNGGWFALPSFLQAKRSPYLPEQSEKRAHVKPRRSKLPSPWRRDRQIVYSDEVEGPSQMEGVTDKVSFEKQQQVPPAKTSILDDETDTDTDSEAEASVPAITTARRWMGEVSDLNLTALLGLSSSPAKTAAEIVDSNTTSVSTEAEQELSTSDSFTTSGSRAADYQGQSVVIQSHVQKIPLRPSHEPGLATDEDTAGSDAADSSQLSHGSEQSSDFPDSSSTRSAGLAPFAKRPLVAPRTPAPSPTQAPTAIGQPAALVTPMVAQPKGVRSAPSELQPGSDEVAQSTIPHTASKATPAMIQHPLLTTGEWKKSHWQLLDKLYMATPVPSRAVLIPQPAKFTAPRGPTPSAAKSPAGAILFARPLKDKEYALMPGEIEFETVDIFMEVMREANKGDAVFTVEYVARRLFALVRGAKIRRELKERETAAKSKREAVSGVRRLLRSGE